MKGYGYLRDGEIARVYFARCLASGRWKIGVTRNVRQRVRMLASHAREAVEVLAVVPGTVSDEAALLRRFAHLAVEGREWFADDGSIAAHVDAQGTLHRAGGRGAVIDEAVVAAAAQRL